MTDSIPTADSADAAPDVGGKPVDAHHGDEPNREAAKYRTRLREAEAERDGIDTRLASYQRREAERIAGATLSRAADLWLDGTEVAELLDDNGDVDPALVALAVKAVSADRPGLLPQVADHGAGRREPRPTPTGWGDVIGRR